jgi:hypothetical protein
MMTRFDVSIIACISLVFIAVIMCVTYDRATTRQAIVEMVAKGANPIAAHCATNGVSTNNQSVCQTAAAQTQSKSQEK